LLAAILEHIAAGAACWKNLIAAELLLLSSNFVQNEITEITSLLIKLTFGCCNLLFLRFQAAFSKAAMYTEFKMM
jgi:hypothetical protein